MKKLNLYTENKTTLDIVRDKFGEELAMLNLLALKLSNLTVSSGLHPLLFKSSRKEELLQLKAKRNNDVITIEVDSETEDYKIQMGSLKTKCDMDFIQVFVLVLKMHHFFGQNYPKTMENFYFFWEEILQYRSEKRALNVTAQRLLTKLQILA